MRAFARACAIASLVLAGCGAAEAARGGAAERDPLEEPWLEGGGLIDAHHLEELRSLGAGDPVVEGLFRDATARIGNGSLEGLASRFSICPRATASEGGLTKVRSADVTIGRSLDDIAARRAPEELARQMASSSPARETRVEPGDEIYRLERTLLPEICIVPGLSRSQAFDAVVHELVHAVRLDPRSGVHIAATAPDETSFLTQFVLVPGGEVEAYSVALRASLRLHRGGGVVSPLAPFFDLATGQLRAPPEALAAMILADKPSGMGYATGLLRDEFAASRRSLATELAGLLHLVDQLLENRRKVEEVAVSNVGVHERNLEVHTHNAALAAQQQNAAMAEAARVGRAETSRHLAETRALLEAARASEARLQAMRTTIAARLESLGPG